jgi:hypothetical protein
MPFITIEYVTFPKDLNEKRTQKGIAAILDVIYVFG